MKRETEFLGHIISTEGIRGNPNKIQAIQDFENSNSQKQIKSFLGLCGFYRKFIKYFAQIAKPMTLCSKKGAKINLNDPSYIKAFEKFKTLISNDPILIYPDLEKKFDLTTDASNYALGAVLSQEGKPICFESKN